MDTPTGSGGSSGAGGAGGYTPPPSGAGGSDYTPPPGGYQPPPPAGYGGGYPPAGYGGRPNPPGPMPENNLVIAIFALLCCFPLGIPSLIFATQVQSKWSMGDFAGAQESANKAKTFGMIGLALWLGFIILYVVLIAVGVASFGFNTSFR